MKNDGKKQIMGGLALITQVGLSIVTPIILGALLGNWLDKKLETKMVFSIVFIILGAFAGFFNLIKLIPKNPNKRK